MAATKSKLPLILGIVCGLLAVVVIAEVALILVARQKIEQDKAGAAAALRQATEDRNLARQARAAASKARAEAARIRAGGSVGNGGGDGGGDGSAIGGGGGGKNVATAGMAALRGRRVWVVTRVRPQRDYCAMLRRAGMIVRCSYAQNKVNLHQMILRCPEHTQATARTLQRYLGLKLKINNWQRENACRRYHEITIYLNR